MHNYIIKHALHPLHKYTTLIVTSTVLAITTGTLAMPSHLCAAESQPASHADATVTAPKEIKRLTVDRFINAVAWNADGTKLAALSQSGCTITLWEVGTWKQLNAFKRICNAYAQNSFAFLPDGTVLTSTPGGFDKTPRDDAYMSDVAHNGENIHALGKFSLIRWNPMTGAALNYFPNVKRPSVEIPEHVGIADTFTVSKDGSLVAGITGGHWVSLYDRNGTLLRVIANPSAPKGFIRSLAFSPNGKELAIGMIFGQVHIYNVASGELTKSFTAFTTDYDVNALAYSPDGQYLAVGKYKNNGGHQGEHKEWVTVIGDGNAVYIWSLKERAVLTILPGALVTVAGHDEASAVRSLAWDSTTDTLAVGDAISLRVWGMTPLTKPELLVDRPISHGAYSVSFSPTGMLAAVDNNHVVLYQP